MRRWISVVTVKSSNTDVRPRYPIPWHFSHPTGLYTRISAYPALSMTGGSSSRNFLIRALASGASSRGFLQSSQSTRTRRWAMMSLSPGANICACAPRFKRRGMGATEPVVWGGGETRGAGRGAVWAGFAGVLFPYFAEEDHVRVLPKDAQEAVREGIVRCFVHLRLG